MNYLTTKTIGVAVFCVTLAACGGSDDPVVDSDAGAGSGSGGGSAGGSTGGGTGGGTSGGTGGGREGGGPDLPDGTPLAANTDAAMSADLPCKLETFDGSAVTGETAVTRTITFDPAALTLSVDGNVNIDGTVAGSTWGYINQSSEYESNSTSTTGGTTTEVNAKIFHTGAPAYFRNKATAADFSYVQLECYEGLIVQ